MCLRCASIRSIHHLQRSAGAAEPDFYKADTRECAVRVKATEADRDHPFIMDLSGGSVSVQPDRRETHKSRSN